MLQIDHDCIFGCTILSNTCPWCKRQVILMLCCSSWTCLFILLCTSLSFFLSLCLPIFTSVRFSFWISYFQPICLLSCLPFLLSAFHSVLSDFNSVFLSYHLPFFLSTFHSVSRFTFLSVFCLHVYVPVFLSTSLFGSPPFCLPIFLSTCLSVCLSFCPPSFFCPSSRLPVFPSSCLSLCLLFVFLSFFTSRCLFIGLTFNLSVPFLSVPFVFLLTVFSSACLFVCSLSVYLYFCLAAFLYARLFFSCRFLPFFLPAFPKIYQSHSLSLAVYEYLSTRHLWAGNAGKDWYKDWFNSDYLSQLYTCPVAIRDYLILLQKHLTVFNSDTLSPTTFQPVYHEH